MKDAGYPDELTALLARDGNCVMAIDRSPEVFWILLVEPNGNNRIVQWTQHDEEIAKRELLDGTIKAYYKHNVKKVFACCTEKKAEDRSDWDEDLSLSRDLSIVCTKQGGSVACKQP